MLVTATADGLTFKTTLYKSEKEKWAICCSLLKYSKALYIYVAMDKTMLKEVPTIIIHSVPVSIYDQEEDKNGIENYHFPSLQI